MRKAFAGLAALFLLAVVVQFFLAASGAFNTAPNDESFRPHRTLGYVIFLLAVVLVIVAAVARMSGRLIGMAGLVAGLVVVQVLIAALARAFDTGDITTTAGQLIFGLHAVNGLAIVAVSMRILRLARALASGPAAGPAPTAS
ncbi:DUF6220 domain-containing protein [Dactylosporangium sp. NPDC049140]|jgi:hypothetical protein|uniref:DUF6220 domain-containing protein n=1 Tax=Dactylosporangium sp. NPDC049140 TaxID=3155647 RepID=UPI0033C36124